MIACSVDSLKATAGYFVTSVVRRRARFLPNALQELLERHTTSPVAARLIRGSLWSVGGSLVSRILALLVTVLVARMLGKATYGQLGIVQTTIGMFGSLASFGMGTAGSKFAEFRHTDPARAGGVIALSSLVSWTSGVSLVATLFVLASHLAQGAPPVRNWSPTLNSAHWACRRAECRESVAGRAVEAVLPDRSSRDAGSVGAHRRP